MQIRFTEIGLDQHRFPQIRPDQLGGPHRATGQIRLIAQIHAAQIRPNAVRIHQIGSPQRRIPQLHLAEINPTPLHMIRLHAQ